MSGYTNIDTSLYGYDNFGINNSLDFMCVTGNAGFNIFNSTNGFGSLQLPPPQTFNLASMPAVDLSQTSSSSSSSDTTSTSSTKLSTEERIKLQEERLKITRAINQIEGSIDKKKQDSVITDSNPIEFDAKGMPTIENRHVKLKDKETLRKADKKKKNFWHRTGRMFKNIGKGIGNTFASLLGCDGPGFKNWNPKKALKNAAMALGTAAICCIPYIGPAIATTLAYAGLASGAVATATGIAKACAADTQEEKDKAWQQCGEGATAAVLSAFGIKGLRAGAGIKNPGKIWKIKETYTEIHKKEGQLISKYIQANSCSAGKAKLQLFRTRATSGLKFAERFNTKKGEVSSDINKKTTEVNKQLNDLQQPQNTPNPASGGRNKKSRGKKRKNNTNKNTQQKAYNDQKKALEDHKKALEQIQKEINEAKTKADWEKLKNGESQGFKQLETIAKDNNSNVESIAQVAENQRTDLLSQVEKLANLKAKDMQVKARTKKVHKNELDEYIDNEPSTPTSKWWEIALKPQQLLKSNTRKQVGDLSMGAKIGNIAEEFFLGVPASVPRSYYCNFEVPYWVDGQYLTKDQTTATLNELRRQEKALKDQLGIKY